MGKSQFLNCIPYSEKFDKLLKIKKYVFLICKNYPLYNIFQKINGLVEKSKHYKLLLTIKIVDIKNKHNYKTGTL